MTYFISCVDRENENAYQNTLISGFQFEAIVHRRYFGIIELYTLIDLMRLTERVGKVIVKDNEIEIYDDYRE